MDNLFQNGSNNFTHTHFVHKVLVTLLLWYAQGTYSRKEAYSGTIKRVFVPWFDRVRGDPNHGVYDGPIQ